MHPKENPNLMILRNAIEEASLHKLVHSTSEFEKEHSGFPQKAGIYILNNHTLENIQWFIKGLCYLDQIDASCKQGNYDSIMQEILDPESSLHRNNYDVIVLSLVLENLIAGFDTNRFSTAQVTQITEKIIESLISNSSSIIVCNTFLLPINNSDGLYSYKSRDSLENKIHEINAWMRKLCQDKDRIYLVDWNQLEQRIGAAQSRDYRLWYVAKSLLKNMFLKEYALEIAKLIRLLKGKSKKCLVLDCDNTIWGGIIGEDGLNHIQLDPHNYPGNIFYAFQQNILRLSQRGVLVALCSKNNQEDVWQVLDSHPHCLLKRSHLAAWRINWEDKAANIESLAKELNLGKDSFVFIDDSKLECELVKGILPEVTVLQVPKDLSKYPSLLFKNSFFDVLSVSDEDKQRTAMYQAERERKAQSTKYNNFDEFLKSLELIVTISAVGPYEALRIAQLTQKTNQFNLTTRRYTETEINALTQNKEHELICLRVQDRFGDLGIVGACILKYEQDSAIFDTFLLSCRALGRKVEDVFLDYCLKTIQAKGKRLAMASYFSTPKNKIVKDFYEKKGFAVSSEDETRRVFTYDMRSFKWQRPLLVKELIAL